MSGQRIAQRKEPHTTKIALCDPPAYAYDALDRLTHKAFPDYTGADYVYDLVGKIQQVTDPSGVYTFAYDNMGRLVGTTTQYSFLPGLQFSSGYGYDAASNRAAYAGPDGSGTTYNYDKSNRLTDLTNSWAGHFGFGYDPLNRRAQLTRPNGIGTSYQYDSLSRVLQVLHAGDGAAYGYDGGWRTLSDGTKLGVPYPSREARGWGFSVLA